MKRIWPNYRLSLLTAVVWFVSFGLFAGKCFSVSAQETIIPDAGEPGLPPVIDQEINELIRLFESDRYRDRVNATFKLAEYQLAALPFLQKSIVDGGPETKIRSLGSLILIAKRDVTKNIVAVEELLKLLTANDSSHVSIPAKSTLAELQNELHRLIFYHLRNSGAVINSNFGLGTNEISVRDICFPETWQGTKEDLMLLSRCSDLYSLEVVSKLFDVEVLQSVIELPNLTLVEIEGAVLDNDSVKLLSKLPSLNSLELRYVQIDDDCIESLEKFTNLTHLGLIGTRISDEGKSRLESTFSEGRLDYRRGGFFGVRYNVGVGPCVLTEVIEGTGAEKAGLKVGDQMVSFNEIPVKGGDDFRNEVAKCFVGDSIEVEVLREGEKLRLTAILGSWKM